MGEDEPSGRADDMRRDAPRVRSRWTRTTWLAADLGRVWSSLRMVPVAVWLITGLFAALLVLHSYLSPLGEPPDEFKHVDLAMVVAQGDPYPSYDGRMTSWAAMKSSFTFRRVMAPRTTEAAIPELFTGTWKAWGGDSPTDLVNHLAQHPPLYYEVTGEGLRATRWLRGDPSSVYREWHLLRYFSIVMLMPLPLLTWATARSLGASPTAQIAAPMAFLAIPQLFHIGSSVNNDNLLTLLAAWLALLLSRVLIGARRWSLHVLIGLLTGLAMLTKAFAVVFPIWIAIVYAARAWRDPAGRRRLVGGLTAAGICTAVVGSWWWIGNLLEHGSFAPTVQDDHYTTDLRWPGFEPDPVWYAQRFGAWMPRRFFGWFGWFEVPMAVQVVGTAAVIFGVGIVLSLWGPSLDRLPLLRRADDTADASGVQRRNLLAMGAILPLLLAFVAIKGYGRYVTTGTTPFLQGRYLFAGLIPIVIPVAVGLTRVLRRWTYPLLLALALVMHIEGGRVILAAWWAEPTDSVRTSFEAMLAWNPWPLGAPRLVLGVVAFLLLILCGELVRSGRSGSPADREGAERAA